jgi:hypothetical protein
MLEGGRELNPVLRVEGREELSAEGGNRGALRLGNLKILFRPDPSISVLSNSIHSWGAVKNYLQPAPY